MLNNTLLNSNLQDKSRQNLKSPKTKQFCQYIYQQLYYTMKSVLRGKFTVVSASIRKTKSVQINNLMYTSKSWKNKYKLKPNTRKEIINIRDKINETEKTNSRNNQCIK